ncbi:MAG: cysteine desulfurase family protein [Patescibacteria group bacterium]
MAKKHQNTIYLDHASATPIDSSVAKLISLYERRYFANASSIHKGGVETQKVIENAREQIAKLIFAHSDEIIFTGSGTESDALAIIGVVRGYKGKNIPHIITTTIEHSAVLENCRMLEKNREAEVTYIMPDADGIINPKDVRDALKVSTALVSVMYANNEIGTVQPIQEIAKIIRHYRKNTNSSFPLLHTDACQAMNYLPTENIEKLGVDLLTFNSSKIYGPKGVGVLYKKRGVNLAPIYLGGGQEFGLRSGTENIAGIAGVALALSQTFRIKKKESTRLIKLRDYGIKKLLSLSHVSGYEIILNGDKVKRLPNNINISISGISSELLVIELDAKGIQVSAKSACKSEELDESYVIGALRKAQNIKPNTTDGSLRISLGRQTKKGDIDALFKALKEILAKYRKWK